ncbi:Vps5 C terminal like [Nesidiocoris tenuis]|uniref:Vps5 C terminal like n=1 Tax=Nesidiocoris tenuis TaxID=355587 RepID=A0ABN7AEP8_9HEMI|nr:Vps5 C terminal like [Nesidiocoris tenuis]
MSSPPPLLDNNNDTDDESSDLFSSAVEGIRGSLPILQLSMDTAGPILSPVEDQMVSTPPSTIPYHTVTKPTGRPDEQFLTVKVTDVQRLGDGMGAYMVYKVETYTNLPQFKKKSCVLRRFSDFLGLHDRLVEKHLRTGRIIPPAPEKSVLGMTKLKMGAQHAEQTSSNYEFIERRKSALERYLQRTADHPVLGLDAEFRDFLQNETELPKATNTSAVSGAGLMRLFNKVGETVNKITYRMDENDTWFEEKTQEIECLENNLRKLWCNVETLVHSRKDLATFSGALARTVAMISNCEEHRLLALALVHLNGILEKIEATRHEQANTDFTCLGEFLKDYMSLIGAVKNVFHERVKVYQNWQHSQLMLNKKREYKAKMDLANRSDKGNFASNEIVEWEAKVERCEEEFNNISQMIKKEMELFEENRVFEFKAVFISYLEMQMEHVVQLIGFWEAFLPEAKAIA